MQWTSGIDACPIHPIRAGVADPGEGLVQVTERQQPAGTVADVANAHGCTGADLTFQEDVPLMGELRPEVGRNVANDSVTDAARSARCSVRKAGGGGTGSAGVALLRINSYKRRLLGETAIGAGSFLILHNPVATANDRLVVQRVG